MQEREILGLCQPVCGHKNIHSKTGEHVIPGKAGILLLVYHEYGQPGLITNLTAISRSGVVFSQC